MYSKQKNVFITVINFCLFRYLLDFLITPCIVNHKIVRTTCYLSMKTKWNYYYQRGSHKHYTTKKIFSRYRCSYQTFTPALSTLIIFIAHKNVVKFKNKLNNYFAINLISDRHIFKAIINKLNCIKENLCKFLVKYILRKQYLKLQYKYKCMFRFSIIILCVLNINKNMLL